MCTGIVAKAAVFGSARGVQGWFPLTQANVSFDHPDHTFLEHAINIDFVNEQLGPSARVAVELSAESARALVKAILAALETGERQGLPAQEPASARSSG